MVRPPLPRPLHHAGHEPSCPRPPGGEPAAPLPQPDGPGRLASGLRTFDLPATPASVRTARGGVRELLTAWAVDDDVRDNAVVVTSELVTNALTHAAGDRIVCRLRLLADRIRIEVEDQARGPGLPMLRRPGPDDQNGRGLLLVDTLSSDWAVTRPPGRPGRVVWAELVTTPHGTDPGPRLRPQGHPPSGSA
ncbi:ATP-binding protein (plasmid) [Streptomyces fungicidicus]|uniref:ATP-binding protein n=1 Tax=Streptomyces fungicidicus TaxID=68203 RepID=A0A494V5J3_9ACTN|nr:ATP-binding protein [Streptomyces fungicidicus]